MESIIVIGGLIAFATIALEIPFLVALGTVGIAGLFGCGNPDIRISHRQLQRLLDENRY